jgi:hypothetical protein
MCGPAVESKHGIVGRLLQVARDAERNLKGAVAMREFKAANISEYQGRPLRLQRHGNRSFACDQCHATSLSGIYPQRQ